jgi:hypothetical protein
MAGTGSLRKAGRGQMALTLNADGTFTAAGGVAPVNRRVTPLSSSAWMAALAAQIGTKILRQIALPRPHDCGPYPLAALSGIASATLSLGREIRPMTFQQQQAPPSSRAGCPSPDPFPVRALQRWPAAPSRTRTPAAGGGFPAARGGVSGVLGGCGRCVRVQRGFILPIPVLCRGAMESTGTKDTCV